MQWVIGWKLRSFPTPLSFIALARGEPFRISGWIFYVSAIIFNQVDYCNSLLYELLWSTIAPLLHVKNACCAAHLRPLVTWPRQLCTSNIGRTFIIGSSLRLHYLCTLHSLASVWSTLRTLWHQSPVTLVDSNYDLPSDLTSSFHTPGQSLAVQPSP